MPVSEHFKGAYSDLPENDATSGKLGAISVQLLRGAEDSSVASSQQRTQRSYLLHVAPIKHDASVDVIDSYSPLPFRKLRQLSGEFVHVLHSRGPQNCLDSPVMDEPRIDRENEGSDLCEGLRSLGSYA